MNIVCIKTMRGDHMIMLAVLSAASMLMLYYGSLMTPTEVYLPISPSTLRHSKPEPEVTTTSTLAPTTTTSTPKLRADANICCQAETPICKACHEGISVEEYLEKQLYKFIKTPQVNLCKKYHVLKGENSKEPDVRICLDNIKPPCNVISVGIAYNFIFDDFMLKHGCRVWSYDPSMRKGNYKRGKLHKFLPIGIGDKDTMNGDKSTLYKNNKKQIQTKTLDTMMRDMGIDYVDVVRIDTEGAEWKFINKLDYSKIGQLLIEIHMWKDKAKHAQAVLDVPHSLFWSARNKWDNGKVYKDMTRVYELGFLKKKRKSIMIGIPLHNRRGYVKFNAMVLKKYNDIDSKDVFIFDDASTEYGEDQLRKWYGKDIHYFRSKKRLNADRNTKRLFTYFSKSNYDILLTLDSDLILDKKWRMFIYDHIDKYGILSLYNSGLHQTLSCNGEICEKIRFGNAGAVMKKSIVVKMLEDKHVRISPTFDWAWIKYFQTHGIKMVAPKNSLVLHYGKIGQNNGCNTRELAKGFNRSILPSWIKLRLYFYFDKCSKPDILYKEHRDFLLFTSAGDKSNVNQWIGNDRLYDIHVVYYGNKQFNLEVDKLYKRKDTKFPNLQWYLKSTDIMKYKAVAVWDDDIVASPQNINSLFKEMNKHNVDVFSPCHTRGFKKCLRKANLNGIRDVEYIEMNAPMFKPSFLESFMRNFDPVIKGWGTDIWFSHVCSTDKKCRISVSDTTCVTNPRTRKDGSREINKAQPEHIRAGTYTAYARKHKLPTTDPKSTNIVGYDSKKFKLKKILCLHTTFGKNSNKMLSLANSIDFAKKNGLKYISLDQNYWKWFKVWFDDREDILEHKNNIKCTKRISGRQVFYSHKIKTVDYFNPILMTLLPKKSIRETAEKIFTEPFVSVHRRHFEGECLWRSKNSYLCNSNEDYSKTCNYTGDDFNHLDEKVILFTDGQVPNLDKTFKNIDHQPYPVQMWAMTLSTIHYGNPMSTVDYIVSHWRKNKITRPQSCYKNNVKYILYCPYDKKKVQYIFKKTNYVLQSMLNPPAQNVKFIIKTNHPKCTHTKYYKNAIELYNKAQIVDSPYKGWVKNIYWAQKSRSYSNRPIILKVMGEVFHTMNSNTCKDVDALVYRSKDNIHPDCTTIHFLMGLAYENDRAKTTLKYKSKIVPKSRFCVLIVKSVYQPYYKADALVRHAMYTLLNEYKHCDISNYTWCPGDHLSNYKCMKDYKFAITMENQFENGYITEKIFNGVLGDTIPIYAGAPDVDKYLNTKRFVNVKLNKTLIDYLRVNLPSQNRVTWVTNVLRPHLLPFVEIIKKLDTNEKMYNSMIKEDLIQNENYIDLQYFFRTSNLNGFIDKFRGGGMSKKEKTLLANVYSKANTIGEWGMGSSTLIAKHTGVKKLHAIDSSLTWVNKMKSLINEYNLKWINIGNVKEWGYPKDKSRMEHWYTYSQSMNRGLDVYLVDGRFRVACAAQALLNKNAYVLIHDFQRKEYKVVLTIANILTQVETLVVLKRKHHISDHEVNNVWEKYKNVLI